MPEGFSSKEYAKFFNAFRMTCWEFLFSERVSLLFVILNELLGEEESLRVRGDE